MGKSVAETISNITRHHLEENGGLLLGQCVTAVGWIGGTVPNCKGIIEFPMTDVAAPAFVVGAALKGVRPIFVIRYQGFMWYNCSSIINYAARSKAVWNQPVPLFLRSIGMEGGGIGHTASSNIHSIFMHVPGIPVVSPMTPLEYEDIWTFFMKNDDPVYVSEHRRSFPIDFELEDEIEDGAQVTIVAISAGRLNALESVKVLRSEGIKVNLFHLVYLKPLILSDALLETVKQTGLALIVDSDFEICGASEHIAFELMHKTGAKVYVLGLKDRVCGVAPSLENITPNSLAICSRIKEIINI